MMPLVMLVVTSLSILVGLPTTTLTFVDTTLIKVAVVHRHGERCVSKPYPGLPINNTSDWPEGWNQLTLQGKKQMYSVGSFIRKRYPSIISGDPSEVRVRSSHRKRCISSTLSLLAGAFVPQTGKLIREDLEWQPIPFKINNSMLWDSAYCREVLRESRKLLTIGEEADFNLENQKFYDFINKVSGSPIVNTTIHASKLFTRLIIAQKRGVSLPVWVTDDVLARLKAVSEKSFFFNGATEKLQKLRSGLLLQDILKDFKNHWSTKKLLIYSTHDGILSILLHALNLYDPPFIIEFGATIIFELHRESPSTEAFVRMFFLRNTEKKSAEELPITRCQGHLTKCYLSVFEDVTNHLKIENWDRECGN